MEPGHLAKFPCDLCSTFMNVLQPLIQPRADECVEESCMIPTERRVKELVNFLRSEKASPISPTRSPVQTLQSPT